MQVSFSKVIPSPLADIEHRQESVWGSEFTLDFPAKVLVNASSGKGKTTFSSIIYGLRFDYTGSVKINGKESRDFTLNEWGNLRRNEVSAVFQDLQLFPDLTAMENLILKNDLTNHRTEEEIVAMMKRLGIGDKLNQMCGTLSLGQQQRVAIIRSLLQPFELLVMDEPFSHLDEGNAEIALQLINEETDKNKAGYILTTLGSHHGSKFDRELSL